MTDDFELAQQATALRREAEQTTANFRQEPIRLHIRNELKQAFKSGSLDRTMLSSYSLRRSG